MYQIDDAFNVYSVSGSHHNVREDTNDWHFDKTFHNGEVNHMGLGPKDYWPDDENIRDKVCERLFRDHIVDASEIEVKVNQGIVTLTGLVSDRKIKKNAESCIENVFGVVDVQNHLHLKLNRGLVGSSEGWPV